MKLNRFVLFIIDHIVDQFKLGNFFLLASTLFTMEILWLLFMFFLSNTVTNSTTQVDETIMTQNNTIFSDLVQWLTTGGAHISSAIHMVTYDGIDYRGIHATRKIDAGEVIISLPSKFIITPAVA